MVLRFGRRVLNFALIALALSNSSTGAALGGPVALGVAILDQDPLIAALGPLPLRSPPIKSEASPGFGSQLEIVQWRMASQWRLRNHASARDVEAAARKVLPRVLKDLADRGVLAKIKQVASVYGIDPLHLLGPIAAEGVFNKGGMNTAQDDSGRFLRFVGVSSPAQKWINEPAANSCRQMKNNYLKWNCVSDSLNRESFRIFRFKDPLLQSYGLGQLSPLRAIMLSDLLARVSHLSVLDDTSLSGAFGLILDDEKSLHVIAASTVMAIASYERIAGVDLAQRPDLTATLYNLGFEVRLAKAIRAKGPAAEPTNNFFGHFVHENIDLLRAALN